MKSELVSGLHVKRSMRAVFNSRVIMNRNLSSCALLVAHSSWRPRSRGNIIIDVSSDVSSDKEEVGRFCFIRLVSVNWWYNISNASRLA